MDELLEAFGIRRSLSRKGNPYDNAVIESTNEILKRELIYRAGVRQPRPAPPRAQLVWQGGETRRGSIRRCHMSGGVQESRIVPEVRLIRCSKSMVLICCSGERVVSWYMVLSGELEGVIGPHGADPGARRSSPTAGAGSPRPCARPGRAPGPEVHLPRPLAGQALRRHSRSSQAGARALPSRATSWASRRCTRPSPGLSATSTGADSGPTSRRTGPWWTAGESILTRG